LNQTPSSERVAIGIFGRRNAGKSSLLNAIAGQEHAVVSDVLGTTTDPVRKAMELLPIGPVLLVDTPGMDDDSELGSKRVEKARQVLRQTDVAVLVADAVEGFGHFERSLMDLFKESGVPSLVVLNKCDLLDSIPKAGENEVYASCKEMTNISKIKEKLAELAATDDHKLRLVADLLNPSDFVALVVPIDKAAPKGRLILPQQQVIRDALEADAIVVVVKEHELREMLRDLGKKPSLVVTDSQVFAKVSADTPMDIPLTSFSILMARRKGFLDEAAAGALAIDGLSAGGRVLVCEGCSHHRQCDDIGSVKLPRWMRQHTGADLDFTFVSGGDYPDDLSKFDLVVHCGGCMLNQREMRHRLRKAVSQGVPLTNYGVLIAHMQGILERCLSPFPHLREAARLEGST
jgi:[FeFe] hydrogenase H-cluster maturation GTPase HydF